MFFLHTGYVRLITDLASYLALGVHQCVPDALSPCWVYDTDLASYLALGVHQCVLEASSPCWVYEASHRLSFFFAFFGLMIFQAVWKVALLFSHLNFFAILAVWCKQITGRQHDDGFNIRWNNTLGIVFNES